MNPSVDATRQALRTPRAAAISGIVFSLLLIASFALIRLALPSGIREAKTSIADPRLKASIVVVLNLAPFAGIAFLWFIGVLRDRMGEREDRFFASVFLGSGILFIAMLFAATAMAAGLVTIATGASSELATSDTWRISRAVTYTLMTTYAMRMAAVFMIATATIALRTRIMPRGLGLLGYACALILLITVGLTPWVEMLFPVWVLVVSVYILIATLHTPRMALAPDPTIRGAAPL